MDAAAPFGVAPKAKEVVGWRADEDDSAPPEGTIAPCVVAPAAGGAVIALGMLWDG